MCERQIALLLSAILTNLPKGTTTEVHLQTKGGSLQPTKSEALALYVSNREHLVHKLKVGGYFKKENPPFGLGDFNCFEVFSAPRVSILRERVGKALVQCTSVKVKSVRDFTFKLWLWLFVTGTLFTEKSKMKKIQMDGPMED